MTVVELARRVDIAPAAIRYYIRTGVLPPPHPLAAGSFGYDERDAAVLRLVVSLRRLGLALDVWPEDRPVDTAELISRLASHAGPAIQARRRALARSRQRIDSADARLAGAEAMLDEARRAYAGVDPYSEVDSVGAVDSHG